MKRLLNNLSIYNSIFCIYHQFSHAGGLHSGTQSHFLVHFVWDVLLLFMHCISHIFYVTLLWTVINVCCLHLVDLKDFLHFSMSLLHFPAYLC